VGGFDPGRERRALPIPTRARRPARRPRSTEAVGEVESCAHQAPGLGRKARSFARKAKSLARDAKSLVHKAPGLARKIKSLAHGPKSLAAKAPGLAREVPEPHCRAKSPAREAPRLGREARRAGAEAEGLEAGARGLGREAWRPGEPARRKAGDARDRLLPLPPGEGGVRGIESPPSSFSLRENGRFELSLRHCVCENLSLTPSQKDSDDGALEQRRWACVLARTLGFSVPCCAAVLDSSGVFMT
jgi:hypothetical protein